MNLAALDLNLLVALEALLEEGSVGRAAQRVGLSQPAMSHALNRLRHLIGDPLLVRVGPRMQLTSRAAALRPALQQVLSQLRELLADEPFDPKRSTRTFRVFVADNATDLLLPPLLRRLRREAPGVSFRIHTAYARPPDATELAGSVDVAVACVPNEFKGFYQRRLYSDRDACVLRRGHALARRSLGTEDFLHASHVAVVGRPFAEDPVDTWLRHEGLERNVTLSVPHYLQALHIVAQSELIAVIPERLTRTYAPALRLEVMTLPIDAGTFDEYLLHPKPTHRDPACVWLRQLLIEVGKSLGTLD